MIISDQNYALLVGSTTHQIYQNRTDNTYNDISQLLKCGFYVNILLKSIERKKVGLLLMKKLNSTRLLGFLLIVLIAFTIPVVSIYRSHTSKSPSESLSENNSNSSNTVQLENVGITAEKIDIPEPTKKSHIKSDYKNESAALPSDVLPNIGAAKEKDLVQTGDTAQGSNNNPSNHNNASNTGEQPPYAEKIDLDKNTSNPENSANNVSDPAIEENIILTVSAVGDCTIGYDETFGYENRFDQVFKNNDYDPKYFFSNVLPIFEADDLTIANLETTFTNASKKASKTYRFRGDPSYVQILEEGSIEAVNIANNHMYDYLQKGFDDTVETLQNSSVSYFGYETYRILELKEGIKVGLAGFHIGAGDWTGRKKTIAAAIDYLNGNASLVILSFHWGIEGNYTPTAAQKSLARFCIDSGVDLVLGHHPHVLQGIENYNGKYIAYSLGNFCFGGNRNPKDKDTMIFQQKFEFSPQKELIQTHEPIIYPTSLSSVKNKNDYKPTVLEGDEAARVAEKIDKISRDIK